MRLILASLLGVVLAVAGAGQLRAQVLQSITVLNPSFELPTTPPLTVGANTTYPGPGNTIPDWMNQPAAGVEYYTTPANDPDNDFGGVDYAAVRDGNYGAFSDSALIWQTLSTPLEAGTYTLTIASGWRDGRSYEGGMFGLYAADGTALGTTDFTQPAVQGTFLDSSITVNIPVGDPEIGQDIEIEMKGLGMAGGTIDFDDVRLDFLAVPEPPAWLLLGAGGLALGFAAMLRRPAFIS